MSYEEFYKCTPNKIKILVKAYTYKQKKEIENQNYLLWLNGLYMQHSIKATIGNMLISKGSKPIEYLAEPIELFPDDEETIRRKREEFVLQTKIRKANFDLMRKRKEEGSK